MKIIHFEFIFFIIISSILFASPKAYKNSNVKKFLSNLGLPDIPMANNPFLDEQEDDEEPTNPVDNEKLDEEEPEEPEDDKKDEEEETKEEEEETKEEEEDDKQEEDDDDKKEEKEKTYVNIKCLWVDKTNVYSLQLLQNKKEDYETVFSHGKITFNFCQNTLKDPEATVIWEKNTTNETKTIKISGSIEGDSKNKNEWDSFVDDDEKAGLKIKLTHGEKCNQNKNHQTYFKIYCDPEIADSEFTNSLDLSEFNADTCNHYIYAKSIYGCALNDWYLLKRLMNEYKIFFVGGFILVGLFFCAFGHKFEKITIVIVMGFIVCYFVLIIVLNFMSSLINTEKRLWIVLGLGFALGGFVGFLLRAKLTLLSIVLGGSMGYGMAEFAYQFVQGFIEWNPQYVYYGTIGVCVLAGVLLGLCVLHAVMIIGTSVIGGYIAMRGVTLIFGNYIDEGQFVDLIKNREFEQLKELRSGWAYAYLGLWLILAVFGIYYQCYGYKKKNSGGEYSKMSK